MLVSIRLVQPLQRVTGRPSAITPLGRNAHLSAAAPAGIGLDEDTETLFSKPPMTISASALVTRPARGLYVVFRQLFS